MLDVEAPGVNSDLLRFDFDDEGPSWFSVDFLLLDLVFLLGPSVNAPIEGPME